MVGLGGSSSIRGISNKSSRAAGDSSGVGVSTGGTAVGEDPVGEESTGAAVRVLTSSYVVDSMVAVRVGGVFDDGEGLGAGRAKRRSASSAGRSSLDVGVDGVGLSLLESDGKETELRGES